MRLAGGLVLATAISVAMVAAVRAEGPTTVAAAPAGASAAITPVTDKSCPGNPNPLGVERTVEIDTTGGPGFGFEHFKQLDFLRAKEVVLTFDDGPWPGNTPAVLAALAAQCTKAVFFPIGKHALWHPEILKQVVAAGMTVGTHTWSHKDLSKLSVDEAKDEIELGASAARFAAGVQLAPFFRFPDLRHPPEMVTYLGERNIAIFSTDLDSFDFRMKRPQQVIDSVIGKLAKQGKGIVLMHDFQHATAEAMPELLGKLKAGGYKIVFMKAKDTLHTLAAYDALVLKEKEVGLATINTRPVSAVVKTINE